MQTKYNQHDGRRGPAAACEWRGGGGGTAASLAAAARSSEAKVDFI